MKDAASHVSEPGKLPDLPVSGVLPDLLSALATAPNAVLIAPPGAGKTTLVPLALLDAAWAQGGRILLLEPRRLAARAAARRMASLLGQEVGGTVGYAMRMESRQSTTTRILVVTEGILSRMILDDPELSGISAILFDELQLPDLSGPKLAELEIDRGRELRRAIVAARPPAAAPAHHENDDSWSSIVDAHAT